jgi:23S rRNA (pseudouridine1915-N3)-methyltransferase
MKIKLLVIGKTEEEYLRTGITAYTGRISHYLPFEITEIPALKNLHGAGRNEWKSRENEKLRKHITPVDCIVLLDERGKEMTSVEFSGFLNQKMSSGIKTLVFIVGGPYGFDDSLKKDANHLISLSRMTFSHQMVRLFFTEQLYRALTILKNESYHHE